VPSRRRLRFLEAIRSLVDRLWASRRGGRTRPQPLAGRRQDADALLQSDAAEARGSVPESVRDDSPLEDDLATDGGNAAGKELDTAPAVDARSEVTANFDSTSHRADVGSTAVTAEMRGPEPAALGSTTDGGLIDAGRDQNAVDAPTTDAEETTAPVDQGAVEESPAAQEEATPHTVEAEPANDAFTGGVAAPIVGLTDTAEHASRSVSKDTAQDLTGDLEHRTPEADHVVEVSRRDDSPRADDSLDAIGVAQLEPDLQDTSDVDVIPEHVDEAAGRDSTPYRAKEVPITGSTNTDGDSDSTSSTPELTTTDGRERVHAKVGGRDARMGRVDHFLGGRVHRERRPTPADVDLPSAYMLWNRVVAEYCLLETTPVTETAYLCITPSILAAALEAGGGSRLSPEDAASQFRSAISEAYAAIVLASRVGLWNLGGDAEDGLPAYVGILAASVLAAYRMRWDDEAGPNAYYVRLAEILGCDVVGGRPRGFDLEVFADLWDALAERLKTLNDRTLARPEGDLGLRRFIAYPLCHVPLRQLDVEKLPEFFDWARLEPGSRVGPSEIAEGLRRWATGRGFLSMAGEQALNDERREAVAAQVALELEAWDGSSRDAAGRQTAAVHLLLDFVRRRPQLEFIARRPCSFPPSFDAGARHLEAGEQGWYDPTPVVPEDGPALKGGFLWTSTGPDRGFSLHRPPSDVVALRPASDFSGYLSQRGLPLGLMSAVLCTSEYEPKVGEYLTAATGVRCDAIHDPRLPTGWRLFAHLRPSRRVLVPPGLEQLEVHVDVSIVLQGGLRVGRRSAWLAGAPPRILVGGFEEAKVSIDGTPASIIDGELRPSVPLGVGVHLIEAERARRRFEIVEPEGRWENAPTLASQNCVAVALPAGHWWVVGAEPGSVVRAGGHPRLSTVHFDPVWAIASNARRAPAVIALARRLPYPPKVKPANARDPNARAWARAVYEAQIRRPRFGARDVTIDLHDVTDAWRHFVATAKQLKRYWRRAR